MKRASKIKFFAPFFVVAAIAVLIFLFSGIGSVAPSAARMESDYVTVEHYTEPDGTVAEVYASGDQYYNYLHDRYGRILVPDGDGYLVYAESDGGKPAATATRWNASDVEIDRTRTMTASDLDFESNPQILNEFEDLGAETDVSAFSSAENTVSAQNKIVNSVVFLRFPDEAGNVVTESVFRALSNTAGESDTLNDYFETVSAQSFGFYNVLPYTADGELFIYTAPQPISYYRSVPSTGIRRQQAEGQLLGAAIAAAKPYLESAIASSGYKTDADGDASVDSVTFFVLSDEPGSDAWNTLLWPHQWSFPSVGVQETLAGATADRYLFMFTSSDRFFSVLTHEMGHVVGAPDLYHYKDTTTTPVGFYDNMASNSRGAPNFWLTATREKYMADAVKEWQVAEITENWDGYTLKAVSAATVKDTLAYKIRLNDSEWLYLEYRMPGVGRYDNNFDRGSTTSAKSGLVVYRVKEGVNGNENGMKPGTSYARNPDEIYVFRNGDVSAAALNLSNPTIGSAENTTLYKDGNLYTTDGRNSKIVVSIKELDSGNQTVRFEIRKEGFPEYGGGTIRSAMVGLSTDSNEDTTKTVAISVPYGDALTFAIYPVYLAGTTRTVGKTALPTELFTISGYNPYDKSELQKNVTVTLDAAKAVAAGYPVAHGTEYPVITIGVTVTDYDRSLSVLSPTERFLIGTKTGFVRAFDVVTAMGKTRSYTTEDAETAEKVEYLVPDGVNAGLTSITMVFETLTAEITVEFYDKAVELRYAYYKNSVLVTAFEYGASVDALPFEVVFASGAVEAVSIPTLSLGFNTALHATQSFTANYIATDGTALCAKLTLYVYKTLSNYTLYKDNAATSAVVSVRFGESFDGSGYVLSARFTDGTSGKYPLFGRIDAKPLLISETLRIEFPEIVSKGSAFLLSIEIKVTAANAEEVFRSTNRSVRIDHKNRRIVADTPLKDEELLAFLSVKNYLDVRFTRGASGGISGATVTVTEKSSGFALEGYVYTVVLAGDANGDNRVDRDDVEALAALYLSDESALKHAIGDRDGDGVYTLFDFSMWLRALTGEDPGDAA